MDFKLSVKCNRNRPKIYEDWNMGMFTLYRAFLEENEIV